MSKRVLIVDDELRVRDVLKGFFDCFKHGCRYEVEAAADGASALNAVKCRDFDLILLDMHLPDVSGLDLLSQIRGFGVRTPVMVVTGNKDGRGAEDALKAGIFAYVPKPVDFPRFDHLVALALATPESAPGAPSPARAVGVSVTGPSNAPDAREAPDWRARYFHARAVTK